MTAQLTPRTEHRLQVAVDLGERLLVLVLFATFVERLSHSLSFRPYNLLILLSEGLVAILIIVRRNSAQFSMRPLDWVIALAGTAFPMLQRAGGTPLLPAAADTVLMSAGLLLAIWAKLSLRYSFGIAAANRGAVSRGAYRLVRHPMYAGYIIVEIGFLLNNPLAWNIEIYAAAFALFIARIFAEERVLSADPDYIRYRSLVRYRLFPGIF